MASTSWQRCGSQRTACPAVPKPSRLNLSRAGIDHERHPPPRRRLPPRLLRHPCSVRNGATVSREGASMRIGEKLSGNRYGSLLVVEDVTGSVVRCKCDCGSVKTFIKGNLKAGRAKSCGCLKRHWMHGTKVYRCWDAMVRRIVSPACDAYPSYGGRGLTMHDEWRDFRNFYRDVGDPPSPAHSLDRINNDKGYFPGNVRWATRKEQCQNRRTNRFVKVGDRILCLSDAASELGVHRATVRKWVNAGKIVEVPRPEIVQSDEMEEA